MEKINLDELITMFCKNTYMNLNIGRFNNSKQLGKEEFNEALSWFVKYHLATITMEDYCDIPIYAYFERVNGREKEFSDSLKYAFLLSDFKYKKASFQELSLKPTKVVVEKQDVIDLENDVREIVQDWHSFDNHTFEGIGVSEEYPQMLIDIALCRSNEMHKYGSDVNIETDRKFWRVVEYYKDFYPEGSLAEEILDYILCRGFEDTFVDYGAATALIDMAEIDIKMREEFKRNGVVSDDGSYDYKLGTTKKAIKASSLLVPELSFVLNEYLSQTSALVDRTVKKNVFSFSTHDSDEIDGKDKMPEKVKSFDNVISLADWKNRNKPND